jgi:hypothetical protein
MSRIEGELVYHTLEAEVSLQRELGNAREIRGCIDPEL